MKAGDWYIHFENMVGEGIGQLWLFNFASRKNQSRWQINSPFSSLPVYLRV